MEYTTSVSMRPGKRKALEMLISQQHIALTKEAVCTLASICWVCVCVCVCVCGQGLVWKGPGDILYTRMNYSYRGRLWGKFIQMHLVKKRDEWWSLKNTRVYNFPPPVCFLQYSVIFFMWTLWTPVDQLGSNVSLFTHRAFLKPASSSSRTGHAALDTFYFPISNATFLLYSTCSLHTSLNFTEENS